MERVTLYSVKEDQVVVGDPFKDIHFSQCPPPNVHPTPIRNPEGLPDVDKLFLYQRPEEARIPFQCLYWSKGPGHYDKRLVAIHPDVKEMIQVGIQAEINGLKADIEEREKRICDQAKQLKMLALETRQLQSENSGYASTNHGLREVISNFVGKPLWRRLWVALFPDKIYDIGEEED